MEPFYLDGWHYFQQGRRCGRAGCRCVAGDLHGPYWYRRHNQTRQRDYLGARLDPALVVYIAQRAAYAGAITAHVAQLARDQALLASVLTGHASLSLADRHRLEQLGYGHILPPAVDR